MTKFRLLAVSLFVAVASAGSASSQTSTTDKKEKFIKTVQLSGDQPPLQSQNIYNVPAGKNFRLTDLIATNGSPGACLVQFVGKTAEILVAPYSTSSLNFTSGPSYGSGASVVLGNNARIGGGSNTCALTYTVMGYLFERP